MWRDVVNIATMLLIVAFLTGAIIRGDKTAALIGAIGDTYANLIKVATQQGA